MPELSSRRRYVVLGICCLSLLIVGMDITIVNVALPSIGRELHGGIADLQWVIDAYTVVLAGLLILSGSTADRLGRKRTFQTGLVVFTAGSLLCSIAPGLGWLVAFRMVQAVGGSMLNPIAMSIVTNVFTDPRERSRAIGIFASVLGLSMGIGPIVGGALTDGVGWESIFWINVPIGIGALVLTALFVPDSRAPRPRRIDPVGQVLVIALVAALVYAIIESPRAGWGAPGVLVPLGISLVSLVGLLWYEPRVREPLIEFRFFRSLPFSGASLTAVCALGGFGGFLFLATLYLQDVRGLSPLDAGLLTAPMAAMVLVAAPLSGRLVGTRGPRLPLVFAGLGMAGGAAMLLGLSDTTSYGHLVLSFVLFGAGIGLVNPPITNAAVSGMPNAQAGTAAALASTSRQLGSSLGVAVIGSLVNTGTDGELGAGVLANACLAEGIVVGCGIAVAVLGLLTSTAHAKRTADRTAATLDPVLG
ncbi:MFS transporter [Actinophytocola oryzae]|uniref:MFS transporter n=1 Tax=Actinophytocola oryzae TaxID=502181 RepID=UPI0010635AD3|nr:MFS transporter [Actinophytocola oryzae]